MGRRSKLRIPDDGPCANHPCDDCDRCKTGDCCGCDVGEAGLPLEGSWPYSTFGELGILVRSPEGLLRCHACGLYFANLGRHTEKHNLTADGYRAIFGLNCGTALVTAEISEARRENGRRVYALGFAKVAPHMAVSSEQRSRWAYKREARAEQRRNRPNWLTPEHQAAAGASKAGAIPEERQGICRAKRRLLEEA